MDGLSGEGLEGEEAASGDGGGIGGGTCLEETIWGISSSLAKSVEGVSKGNDRRSSGVGEKRGQEERGGV